MKTILVVFTNTKLGPQGIRMSKKYSFNTSSEVKEGDMIKTAKYNTSLQVTRVLDKSHKYYNSLTGELSDEFNSSSQNEILELQLREDAAEVVYGSLIVD